MKRTETAKGNFVLILFLFLYVNSFGQNNANTLFNKSKNAVFEVITYDQANQPRSIGTGFFVEQNGLGVTNYHVLKDAYSAKIKMADGRFYQILNIKYVNEEYDLVKFTISNGSTPVSFLKFAKNLPNVGDDVFVIGSPKGLEFSMSTGIVSSVRSSPSEHGKMNLIQTTAPISHGNSGSPLMNQNGEVLGIITFSYNDSQNLNFAIDISKIYFNFPAIQYTMPLDKNARPIEEDDYEKELRENGSFTIKDRVSAFVGQDREIIRSQFKDWDMIVNSSDLLAFSYSGGGVFNYYFEENPSICDGESYTIEKGNSTNEFIQRLFDNGYKRANGETGSEEVQSFYTRFFVIRIGPENPQSTKNLVICAFNPNYHIKRKK